MRLVEIVGYEVDEARISHFCKWERFNELDRSNNTWDKTRKYNLLYETEKYADSFWVEHAKVFPVILCVTEDKNRLAVIEQSVRDENTHGLRFDVRLLKDLIGEVVVCTG